MLVSRKLIKLQPSRGHGTDSWQLKTLVWENLQIISLIIHYLWHISCFTIGNSTHILLNVLKLSFHQLFDSKFYSLGESHLLLFCTLNNWSVLCTTLEPLLSVKGHCYVDFVTRFSWNLASLYRITTKWVDLIWPC